LEHGFNGLAKAKRGFSLILIASLLFDFHGFNSAISSLKQVLLSFGVGVVLQGFQILGLDEKTKNNKNAFHPEPKFETLAALFDF
jgi:hypothetical protein